MLVVASFSSLFSYHGFGYIYWVALFFVTAHILIHKKIRLNFDTRFIGLLMLLNVSLVFLATIKFNVDIHSTITVLVRYFAPMTYALLLISSKIRLSQNYYNTWYVILIIFTLLAFVQYFINPNLWGVIPRESSTLFDWSYNKPFSVYASYFRATSLLGSPQVWGAFSAISIVALNIYKTNGIKTPYQYFLWAGAFLSGGKIVVIIFTMYMIYKLYSNFLHIALLGFLVGLCVFLFVDPIYFESIRVIEHVVMVDGIVEQEQNGRLKIWVSIISDIHSFFGGGASYIDQLDKSQGMVSESYFIQAWVEATIVLPFILLYIILRQVLLHKRSILHIILYLAIGGSMIASHAFSHPVFIIIWPFLLSHCRSTIISTNNRY